MRRGRAKFEAVEFASFGDLMQKTGCGPIRLVTLKYIYLIFNDVKVLQKG